MDKARRDVVSKRQNVKQIEAQLAAANARLEQASLDASIAAEAYNGAVWKLSEARKAYGVAQAQEKQAKADVAAQRDGIVALVTESYQNGTELNSATAMMSDEGPEGLMNRFAVVQSAGDSMEAHYDAYRKASARAKVATAKALKARKHQETLAAEARRAPRRGQCRREQRGRRGRPDRGPAAAADPGAGPGPAHLGRAGRQAPGGPRADRPAEGGRRGPGAGGSRGCGPGEGGAGGQEEGRPGQEGPQAGRELRRRHRHERRGRRPPVSDNPPAPGTGVQRALAYARAQLGKPYKWGAAGPNSFDCSGLTMMAWRAGGKSLPHWSVAQFQQSTRIGVGQLRPGDLAFWGSSPGSIHHVAMYIGNGQIIHAPRTGQPVQINSMYYWVPPDYYARP